jgi:gamma-glutamyltranspeptidase
VHDAASGTAQVFNGSGVAPLGATAADYADGILNWGPRSVSVPGLLAGVAAMHAAHGSRPWTGLVAPAIALAREGFGATHTYCRGIAENHERLAADPRSAATFLGKQRGDFVVQPDLARTLEEIAADGAEGF